MKKILCVICVAVLCAAIGCQRDYGVDEAELNFIKLQGSGAYTQGVSEDANPYIGDQEKAKAWLDGWSETKEQATLRMHRRWVEELQS